MMEGAEDERREAAIASSKSLSPDFNPPKSSAVTQTQLSKFQELHTRRLQLKSKSKSTIKKKTKGRIEGSVKSKRNNFNVEECGDHKIIETIEEHVPLFHGDSSLNSSKAEEKSLVTFSYPKKPQKLHWGLDTKERWERKSNM